MALIAVAADKGAPGVTTSAVALAAVWPRPVLLAECDPAGGDIVYRLPGADGTRLDPRRGLLSLAVAARRGLQPSQVWEHAQKLHGGLDVLAGVTSAEQGAGLDALWDVIGGLLSRIPQADVIADCGRIGRDGPFYDLLAEAEAVVLVTRASLAEAVRLRDRAVALTNALQRRGRPGVRVGVVVIADHKTFKTALAEVGQAIGRGPASVIGGLAYEPKSADQLRGQWGGKLDRSLLIRTAREIASFLAGRLPDARLSDAQFSDALQPAAADAAPRRTGAPEPRLAGPAVTGPQPMPSGNSGMTGPQPMPSGNSGMTGPQPMPSGNSGTTGPQPMPSGNSGTTGPQPMPSGNSGVTGPQPMPSGNSGVTGPQPMPSESPGQAPPMTRGRHAGPPPEPAMGTEQTSPDHLGPLPGPPRAIVSGGDSARPGNSARPGDPGGW